MIGYPDSFQILGGRRTKPCSRRLTAKRHLLESRLRPCGMLTSAVTVNQKRAITENRGQSNDIFSTLRNAWKLYCTLIKPTTGQTTSAFFQMVLKSSSTASLKTLPPAWLPSTAHGEDVRRANLLLNQRAVRFQVLVLIV